MMARMSSIIPSEEEEQQAFVQWLTINKIPHFHCPNEIGGQTRSLKLRAIKMKKMGVSKGVPDLFVFIPVTGINGHIDAYQPIAIEMKRAKNSTTSKEQKDWLKIIGLAGIPCAVCKGAEKAIEFVNSAIKEISDDN